MNVEEKLNELNNVECLDVKYRKLNVYDEYYQFKLSNGEYIDINTYGYIGEKIDKNSDNIFVDEGLCVWNDDIIDKVDDDNFWESEMDNYISEEFIKMTQEIDNKNFECLDVYNKYIELVNYYLDTMNCH